MGTCNKRGQVWIETVTYTLIALVMIGLILSFAKPKIEEMRDKVLIEQSLRMMKEIDQTIFEVGEDVAGNKRKLEINLKKGLINVNGENETLMFSIDSRNTYSEPGQEYIDGNFNILTTEKGKLNTITITRNYTGEYDLLYKNENSSKIITRSSNSYNLFVTNKGGETKQINIEIN